MANESEAVMLAYAVFGIACLLFALILLTLLVLDKRRDVQARRAEAQRAELHAARERKDMIEQRLQAIMRATDRRVN
jgi:hypothetical protein